MDFLSMVKVLRVRMNEELRGVLAEHDVLTREVWKVAWRNELRRRMSLPETGIRLKKLLLRRGGRLVISLG